MIKRYSREEIASIWELEQKFGYYLKVELAVVKAQVELGNFKPEIYENIKKTAKFDVARIDEIEAIVRHDVIAFLQNVNENVGKKYSPFIHKGLTSSDVIDTASLLSLAGSVLFIFAFCITSNALFCFEVNEAGLIRLMLISFSDMGINLLEDFLDGSYT